MARILVPSVRHWCRHFGIFCCWMQGAPHAGRAFSGTRFKPPAELAGAKVVPERTRQAKSYRVANTVERTGYLPRTTTKARPRAQRALIVALLPGLGTRITHHY